ncbi:hypothetical protein ABBQ38_008596 [Trebouxia sp. C0009 RCD-2024]
MEHLGRVFDPQTLDTLINGKAEPRPYAQRRFDSPDVITKKASASFVTIHVKRNTDERSDLSAGALSERKFTRNASPQTKNGIARSRKRN